LRNDTIPPPDKRKLYRTLSFERKAAERKLRAKIKRWRAVSIHGHPRRSLLAETNEQSGDLPAISRDW